LDSWPVNRDGVNLSVVGNHKFGPVSRFSYASNEPYMGAYSPKTNAGVVHYSARTDLPSKKVFSWGSDAEGLEWRKALSDNDSAYVEIQAGLFRDQETYGFLDPQQSIHFTELWMPVLEIGGIAYATPGAILNLEAAGSTDGEDADLGVALNVTRDFPNAKLEVLNGNKVIDSETVSLSPKRTFRKRFSERFKSGSLTVTLTDESGKIILAHTRGKYDFLRVPDMAKELPPPHAYPPVEKQSESDFLEMGNKQESDGEVLIALATYREGLKRYPGSFVLRRARGRLDVGLKQYDDALAQLQPVLDQVSTDKEASYYLGLAYLATSDLQKARRAFEVSEQFGTFRAPSLFELAALDARKGELAKAHEKLVTAYTEFPDAFSLSDFDVALLRHLGNAQAATQLLAKRQLTDSANSFLRYEAALLGHEDPTLWQHLAADPERILNIAVLYMHFGFFTDAIDLLSRNYPSGEGVVSEPGMPRPANYPLLAYYRGFSREMLHQDGNPDFRAAAQMSTTYVFPNRPESFEVLKRALSLNPGDANAHALLGSLYMSGGMEDAAMREWDAAREINPAIPALLRNMGYTALYSKQSPERAIEFFTEGTKSDPQNPENYLGLERALREARRPPEERVAALQKFPGSNPPATLIFQLARDLADAGRYDEAQKELATRFVSLEEGGASQLDLYLEIKLKQAHALAAAGHCEDARNLLQHLADPVPQLSLTKEALELATKSTRIQKQITDSHARCNQP
jgi:tetratricopeptide (TPR) repeat protein